MKKTICLLIISILLAAFLHAQEEIEQPIAGEEDFFPQIESALKPYVGKELGAAGALYGNEVVNAYTMDGKEIGYVITSDGVFTDLGSGTREAATMNIYVEDGDTINSIMEAEDPLDKFYEFKGEGKIKVEPVGFGKKVKFFFTNIIGRVVSWFTGPEEEEAPEEESKENVTAVAKPAPPTTMVAEFCGNSFCGEEETPDNCLKDCFYTLNVFECEKYSGYVWADGRCHPVCPELAYTEIDKQLGRCPTEIGDCTEVDNKCITRSCPIACRWCGSQTACEKVGIGCVWEYKEREWVTEEGVKKEGFWACDLKFLEE